jgi:hypothetical protein
LFFKLFGVSIQSVILGKLVLVFLNGILIFLVAARLMSLPMALAASLWYWAFSPEFFYTYNHIGGIFFSLAALYCLLRYYFDPRRVFLYLGLGAIFLLNLIRVNVGIAGLVSYVACLLIMDRQPGWSKTRSDHKYFFLAVAGILLLTGAVYYFFMQGLSPSAMKQCFPYFSEYRPDRSSLGHALSYLFKIVIKNFTATGYRVMFAVLLLSAASGIVYFYRKFRDRKEFLRNFALPTLFLSIFLVLNLHEYLSSASLFRLTWVFPFGLLIFFMVLERGFKPLPKGVLIGVLIYLCFVSGGKMFEQYRGVHFFKQPVNLLEEGKTRVFVNAHLQQLVPQKGTEPSLIRNPWILTVKQTVEFLRKAEKTDGKGPIVAIPYDSLYYFLSGRDSAVYPLGFFSYINISTEDEKNMIRQMEEKNVRFVLVSSRANSLEPDLRVFGKDYCPLLAQYLTEKFHVVATFGDWQQPPGFTEGHGIKVLERN